MTAPVTCSACHQQAYRNARGELMPHTRPDGIRMTRFGTMQSMVAVCEAVKRGVRA